MALCLSHGRMVVAMLLSRCTVNARFLTPFVRAFQLRGDPPSGDAAVVGPVRRSRAVLALSSQRAAGGRERGGPPVG